MPAASRGAGVREVVLVLSLAVVVTLGVTAYLRPEPAVVPRLRGLVVDASGRGIAAVVHVDGRSVRTGSGGGFTVRGGPTFVTATAPGFLPRTRALGPGPRMTIRLAPDAPGTVTLAFGGDVMFGRRYFDPDEDGVLDGLLRPDSTPAEHAALLAGVAPLLRDADLAAVNLETPLAPRPYADPTQPRPPVLHPTKDYAFASSPAAATALRQVGVDVVDLGNNHLFDRLDAGVRSTRTALTAAGFAPGHGFFGAGTDEDEAWQPAVREVRGVRVAFVGCTSILGREHPISYVAGPAKGGAAPCDAARLTRAVRAAATTSDIVVVMIHGGFEYGREPSAQVRELSDAAVTAGAALVVNHHPHVVGGLKWAAGDLTAWTMGNLLFDQTVWPTFDSYVLHVAVRENSVVSAWLDPLRIDGFVPRAVYGRDADWVVRGAEARSAGPWIDDDASLWLDSADRRRQRAAKLPAAGLWSVAVGCSPDAGRDLLWTGDFEARDLGGGAPAPLWKVGGQTSFRRVTTGLGVAGSRAVALARTASDSGDAVVSPIHRVLVAPEDRLTLLVSHRAVKGSPDARLQLSWYDDTRGPSQRHSVVPLDVGDGWGTTRVDVRVPARAVAVQPYVRLAPATGDVDELAVDDVRLVDWDEPGCDVAPGGATLTARTLPPAPARPSASRIRVTQQARVAVGALPPVHRR